VRVRVCVLRSKVRPFFRVKHESLTGDGYITPSGGGVIGEEAGSQDWSNPFGANFPSIIKSSGEIIAFAKCKNGLKLEEWQATGEEWGGFCLASWDGSSLWHALLAHGCGCMQPSQRNPPIKNHNLQHLREQMMGGIYWYLNRHALCNAAFHWSSVHACVCLCQTVSFQPTPLGACGGTPSHKPAAVRAMGSTL